MNIKADHRVTEDGRHQVSIEGLKVWIYESGSHWVAQGLDIDLATAGDTADEAMQAFMNGLCLTILEHLKRFQSLEKLVSRRAPDDIYKAWVRELEKQKLAMHAVEFTLPESELRNMPQLPTLPHKVKFFESAHAH